jgi:hypothetical protein
MPSRNLSFRTPPKLLEQIQSRDLKGVDNPGAVAKRDVERWYEVLQESMREVRLNPAEAVVLIYYAGSLLEDSSVSLSRVLMAHHIIGSGGLGLESAFTPVSESLADKMAGWSLAGKYAAWDAAERYEVVVRRNLEHVEGAVEGAEDLTFGMALHRVGLHTYDLLPDELAVIERMGAVPADMLPGAYLRALREAE